MILRLALMLMRIYVQIFGEDRALLGLAMAIPEVSAEKVRAMFEVAE